MLEENAQLTIIKQFKQEISESPFPEKNILESILANLYWQYFNQNRWQFYNRTHTQEKVDATDFRTWDLKTLFAEVHQHFQASLQQEVPAQKVALKQFNEILIVAEGSKKFRPTLFDFLAHHALDFYKSSETTIINPAYKFEIDHEKYFKNSGDLFIETKEALSLQYHALKIYQSLLNFHEKDQDPTAFVTVALERLDFVRNHATMQDKDGHYVHALKELKERYEAHKISASVDFQIATFYNELGESYQPKNQEQNRFKKREALAICEAAIAKFPKSMGAQHCAMLRKDILNESLVITTEKYVPIGLPSRLLVDYKNMDSLFLKVFKAGKKEITTFNQLYNDSARLAFIETLSIAMEWKVGLNH